MKRLLSYVGVRSSVKAACVLSGCGYGDGAEITESVSTIIGLWRNECDISYFSLDKPTAHVLHHGTFEECDEDRNVLVESIRISRDAVSDLSELNVDDFDMIVLPGGFGAAKNLSDFAFAGEKFEIDDVLEQVLVSFHEAGKPIGAACISPILIAKIFGEESPKIAIGGDEGVCSIAENFGAETFQMGTDESCCDVENKISTTPAYMNEDADPWKVFNGIGKMVDDLIGMI